MSSLAYVQLGKVAEFIRGINFKPEDVVSVGSDGTVICLRTKNVQEQLDCNDLWAVPREFVRRDNQILAEGDILVSSANSWNLVGKCCWIPALEWPASFGGFVSVLRANPSAACPRYLYRWFASDKTQALLRSFGQKTTNISNLNIERCLNLSVPLPPLPEQRRIAAILDKADALRTKRREALAQLDSLTQSIFIEMFGDPLKNPRQWKTRPLLEICDEINDCPHSTPLWTDEGEICLRTSNLTEGGWNWDDTRYVSEATYHERSKRGYVASGDIVLSREGTVGIAAIVNPGMKICMGQRLVQVRPSQSALVPEFLLRHLLYILSPMRIGQMMVGSTSQHLNVKELKALRIPLPPIDLQRKFARHVGALEKLKNFQTVSLAELDTLFSSLQHRAFRGEL